MYGKVKTSIWAIDDQPLPLKRTQIRGRIWNFQAKLTIEQEYVVPSAGISKKTALKFPLHDLGTICGYEAVVGGKRIASEIKKKKEASSKFKEATNSTVESNVKFDCSDVLVCHVSKLAPSTSIVIKVTCVTELLSDGDTLRLVLPTTIAPRIYPHEYKDNQPRPAVLSEYELGLDVNVQTFLPIEAVTSPTHPVVLKHLDNSYKSCNVTLDSANTQPLTDADLVLDVKFKLPISHSLPHCFVEKYEEIKKMVNRTALMIAFQPQFEELIKDESEPCEYLIVVDSAQQPDYELVQRAVAVALEELKTQRRARFNLFVLSNILYRVFEEESVSVSEENMKAALEYVHGGQMEKDFKSGSRELYVSLEDVYSIPRLNQESQVPIQMLLITTAQVSSSGTLLSLVSSHAESYTVFPLGIGVGANYYVLNSIARMSFGYAEFEVAPDLVLTKVRRQVRRGLQTMLDEVTLDWGDLEEFVTPAPEQLPLVFSGDFLAVYAFLEEEPDQKKFDVTLKAILGDRSKKFTVSLDLDTSDSINDNTIHLMTATERLFDLEEEMEDEEENEDVNAAKRHRSHEEMELIAINYGFASNYTSFFINDKATQTVIVSHYNDVSPFDEEGEESEPEVEEEPVKKKKVYDLEFLLRYQPLCTERPEGMTNITSIVKGTPAKDSKRQPEKTHLIANKSKKRQDTRKKPAKDDKPSTPKKKIDIKGKWSSGNEVPVNHEALYKKITSLMNKLTRENFKSITEQILKEGAGITDLDALRGVIKLIFDKAVIEHNFSTMYADLCVILADQFPQFEDPNSTDPNIKFTFKRLLLNECQREFEEKPFLQETNVKVLSTEELEIIAKKRMLGNINFVGELYKKKLLASKIIHGCLIQLLGELRSENPETTDKIPPVENLELLCKLLRTVGKILETDKDSQLVDVYFHTVAQLSKNKGLDRRSYFMLLDLVDLRKAKWIPRSPQAVDGPKTISEIHREAKQQEREQRLQIDREIAKSREEERAKRKQEASQGGWETVGSNTSTPAGKGRRGASTPGSGRGGRDTGRGGSAKKGRGGKDVSPSGRDLAKSTSGAPRYVSKDGPSTGKKSNNPREANMFNYLSASDDNTHSPTPSPYKPRQGKNEPKRDIKITASMEIPRDDESDEEEVPAKFQPKRSLAASMSAVPPPDDESDEDEEHGGSDEPSGDNEAKIDLMLEEYLTGGDIEDALQCLRDFKSTSYDEFVNRAIVFSLEKKEKDCDAVMRLLTEFYKQNALNKTNFEKGFAMVLELVEDFYIDIPFTYKYVGQFFGHCIAEGVLTLNDLHTLLQPLLETEAAEKIAAEAFGKVLDDSGADRLSAMINDSKLSIKDFIQTDYKSDASYIKKLLESKEALKTILLP